MEQNLTISDNMMHIKENEIIGFDLKSNIDNNSIEDRVSVLDIGVDTSISDGNIKK